MRVYPAALTSGDLIVGERNGTSFVLDVEASSLLPGHTLAITEHGSLYLDNDIQVTVDRTNAGQPSRTHVLVTGTPADGFTFIGPVTPNDRDLEHYTDVDPKPDYWWYAELSPLPAAPIDGELASDDPELVPDAYYESADAKFGYPPLDPTS